MTKEHLTVFILASLRKYLKAQPFGIEKTFLQFEAKSDEEATDKDEVQFLFSLDFPPRGAKNEEYAIVNIQALVKTKVVPTDVFYHTRMKARVVEALAKPIPLLKVGGEDTTIYTKSQIGIMRPVPSETVRITPSSIDIPDSSVVEAYYEIQIC